MALRQLRPTFERDSDLPLGSWGGTVFAMSSPTATQPPPTSSAHSPGRPIKVADVAEFYADRGGGVRTYINQKLAHGARLGHEVVVIAPGPEDGVEERHGGRIVWIKGPPMPLDPRYYVLWNEAAVHRALDREQPDVVEGSSPWSGGWFAARWQGKAPKAFIFHQDPVAVYPQTLLSRSLGMNRVDQLFGWYWGYLRNLARRYDATVVSGHWLAQKLKRFGLPNPVAVPFGISKDRFSPSNADAEHRTELLNRCGIDPQHHGEATLWINMSRFHPEKRLGTLFKAFALARKRRPHMGLLVFGDGPLKSWVTKRAAATPGVHLAGFVPDREAVARGIACGDAMVHGSAAETYGLVIAEGLCSGLPLVVPDVGGAADLAHPDYAEVYRPGDARACAAAMERLMRRNQDTLSAAVAHAAEHRVGTMDDHFDGLFALYERLAAGEPT